METKLTYKELEQTVKELENIAIECTRAEEKLQSQKNTLESVIGAMSSGLTIRDLDYNLIFQNDVLIDLFGNHVGEKCYRVFQGIDEVCDGCPVELAYKDGKSHTSIRRVETPSGEITFWENVANPIRDPSGKIISCLEINTNITDSKQAEEQIKTSLKEKEVLLREIHHRVKNNFQIISSLLDMIKMRTRNQEAIDLLTDARSKIYTMALVHTQLYEQERFDRVNMGGHIRKLVDYLSQTYGGRGKSIHTMIEASDVYLEISQAIPCALVLSEIISNAFKHAFAETQKGTIEISAQRSADNTIFISVEDDGMGIPEEIDIYKANSLGLKLIRNIVEEQLMGKVQVERSKGTNISIEFKALEEKARHV